MGGMAWQEWWTYRPSDFLMFSPRVYWQLFAQVNQAWWPAAVALAAGLVACVWRAWRAAPGAAGATAAMWASLMLGAAWCLVALVFHHQRFAAINSAATWYAWACGAQGALLVLLSHSARWRLRRGPLALLTFALLAHPLLAGFSGRAWQQAEVFGLAPDPTAYATLALTLMWSGSTWQRRALMVLPLLWCLVSTATLAVMGSAQAWVPLVVLAAVAIGPGRWRQKPPHP